MCNTREENAAELAQEEAMREDQEFRCPACGGLDDFEITAIQVTTCFVNGRGESEDDEPGDIEWSDDSQMVCASCDHTATVKDFEIDNQAEAEA